MCVTTEHTLLCFHIIWLMTSKFYTILSEIFPEVLKLITQPKSVKDLAIVIASLSHGLLVRSLSSHNPWNLISPATSIGSKICLVI